MAFKKGQSGNKSGRPKETQEIREQKEQFRKLLRANTVIALESIIEIAQGEANRDKLKACQYIIDKAYGAKASFLDNEDLLEDIMVRVVPYRKVEDDEW